MGTITARLSAEQVIKFLFNDTRQMRSALRIAARIDKFYMWFCADDSVNYAELKDCVISANIPTATGFGRFFPIYQLSKRYNSLHLLSEGPSSADELALVCAFVSESSMFLDVETMERVKSNEGDDIF